MKLAVDAGTSRGQHLCLCFMVTVTIKIYRILDRSKQFILSSLVSSLIKNNNMKFN